MATLLAVMSPLTSPKTKIQSELIFPATNELLPTFKNLHVKSPFTVPLKNNVPSYSTSALQLKIFALFGKSH